MPPPSACRPYPHRNTLGCSRTHLGLGTLPRLSNLNRHGSTARSAVQQSVVEVTYTSDELPPAYVGPIQLTTVAGKGRGIVTTRAIQPGELLMVDTALCILRHPQRVASSRKPLEAADLTEKLMSSRYTLPQLQALEAMYDGNDSGVVSTECLADLQNMLYAEPDRALQRPNSPSDGPAGPPSTSGAGGSPVLLPRRKVQNLVELNAWGLPMEDLAACRCRGQDPYAHLGLWPLFSMVNHSCAPNASPLVLGDRMLLRACTPIAQGSEVCINYAGVIALSPLEVRQGMLERNHRFLCRCSRCNLEAKLAPVVGDILLTVFEAVVRQVQPHVKAAVEKGDMASAEAALQQLHSYTVLTDDIMTQMCQQFKLSRHAEMLLRASLYVVPENLENMDLCTQQGGAPPFVSPRPELENLAECLRLCSLVCGGSDHHTGLAVRYLARVRDRLGDAHPKAQAAEQQLLRAFRARYGDVPHSVMQRLVLASQATGSKPLLLRV